MDSPLALWLDGSLFEQNLRQLEEFDPSLADRLATFKPTRFQPTTTDQGEPNLLEKASGHSLSPQEGAKNEVEAWAKECEFEQYDAVYVCGCGLGFTFDPFEKWLEENERRYLIFLETDLEILFFFLHTEQAEKVLKHPQVAVVDVSSKESWDQTFNELLWKFWAPHVRILISPYDLLHRFQTAYHLSATLYFQQWIHRGQLTEYLSPQQIFYRNFYRNLFELPYGSESSGLFGQFQDVPAIICGAGPSLESQMEQLKKLRDRAIIFAGGSALNVLSAHGLQPHFGGGIDPNQEQLHRLLTNDAFMLPFFFDFRMNAHASHQVSGPKIFLKEGGSSLLPGWFEDRLQIGGDQVEGGCNIGNLCMEIAAKMGCNPIILAGFDLAYTKKQTYAKGIVRHPLWVEDPDPYEIPGGQERTPGVGHDGKPIETNWQWIAESQYIQSLPSRYPHIEWVNAVADGLALPTLKRKTLDEVEAGLTVKPGPLDARIHAEVEEHRFGPQVNRSAIFSLCREIQSSLERCRETFLNQLADLRTAPPEEANGVLRPQEWKNEVAFEHLLQRFDQFFVKSLKREEEAWRRKRKPISEEQLKKENLIRRLEFLLLTIYRQLESLQSAAQEEIFAPDHAVPSASIKPSPVTGKVVCRYGNGMTRETIEDGVHRFYSSSGVLLAQVSMSNGNRQGPTTTYYSSGELASQQYYENGIAHGTQRYFYPGGVIRAEIPYKKGVLDGTVTLYHRQGEKKRLVTYRQRIREGKEQLWDRQGRLLFEGEWSAGQPCGRAREWLPTGQLVREITFETPGGSFSLCRYDKKGRLIKKIDNGKEDYSPFYEEVEKKVDQLEKSLSTAKEAMDDLLLDHPNAAFAEEWQEILKEIDLLEEKKNELRERGATEDE